MWFIKDIIYHIGVGSTLLVLQYRAIARASVRGTGNRSVPTSFLYMSIFIRIGKKNIKTVLFWELADIKTLYYENNEIFIIAVVVRAFFSFVQR